MKQKFGVKIMPRDVILDTQGRAVEQTLRLNKMEIGSARVGRFVELEIEGTEGEARARADEIAKFVLHNPLIETYEIQKL